MDSSSPRGGNIAAYRLIMRVFVTLLFPLFANAATDAGMFYNLGAKIPNRLIAQGKTQFGSIHLPTFVEAMKSVRVREFDKKEIVLDNGDGRSSARWDKNKGIDFSESDLKRFPQQAAILSLHEYLGMMGYVDHQYWISLGMWFLSQPETAGFLNENETANYEAWLAKNTRLRYAKGSVVGVGGGGEIGTLWARCSIILKHIRDARAGRESRAEAIDSVFNRLTGNLTVTYYPTVRPRQQ